MLHSEPLNFTLILYNQIILYNKRVIDCIEIEEGRVKKYPKNIFFGLELLQYFVISSHNGFIGLVREHQVFYNKFFFCIVKILLI